MKLKIVKDFEYAFDHINATEFKEGQELDSDNPRFIEVVLEAGLAVEVLPPAPKKKTPKANKRAKGPSANK